MTTTRVIFVVVGRESPLSTPAPAVLALAGTPFSGSIAARGKARFGLASGLQVAPRSSSLIRLVRASPSGHLWKQFGQCFFATKNCVAAAKPSRAADNVWVALDTPQQKHAVHP